MTHKSSGKLSNYPVLQIERAETERKEHGQLKSCPKWVTELSAELRLQVIPLLRDFQLKLYSTEAVLWSDLFPPEDFSSILTLGA